MQNGSCLMQYHAIDLFLGETSRYPTVIVERKEEELKSKLESCVRDLVNKQIESHQVKAVELLHRLCKVNEGLPMIKRLENAYTESWEFFSAGLEGIYSSTGKVSSEYGTCFRYIPSVDGTRV